MHGDAVLGAQGGRYADAHRQRCNRFGIVGDGHAKRFGTKQGGSMGQPRHEQHELLAPIPAKRIAVTRGRAQHFGDALEHGVPCFMPQPVVDTLEVVYIHHKHRQSLPRHHALPLEVILEHSPVCQACQRIGGGQLVEQSIGLLKQSLVMPQLPLHLCTLLVSLEQLLDLRADDQVSGRLTRQRAQCFLLRLPDMTRLRVQHAQGPYAVAFGTADGYTGIKAKISAFHKRQMLKALVGRCILNDEQLIVLDGDSADRLRSWGAFELRTYLGLEPLAVTVDQREQGGSGPTEERGQTG